MSSLRYFYLMQISQVPSSVSRQPHLRLGPFPCWSWPSIMASPSRSLQASSGKLFTKGGGRSPLTHTRTSGKVSPAWKERVLWGDARDSAHVSWSKGKVPWATQLGWTGRGGHLPPPAALPSPACTALRPCWSLEPSVLLVEAKACRPRGNQTAPPASH